MPYLPAFTTRPEILGTFGVVTSTHWLATATGMATLEKGGNAFDAAVALGFALQVVEPHLNGPGGEVPLVLCRAGGEPRVICGQGVAPAAATIARYRDLGLDLVPGTGLLSAVVPGAFDAWMLLLRDYGTLELRAVLEPAIALARDGHPLVHHVSNTIETVADLFRAHWPSSAALYLPGGAVPEPASLFRNPVLAETYARILREAQAAGGSREARIEAARGIWSRGFVAESIDAFCRDSAFMDSTGRCHGGLLTGEDMARWQATEEAPLRLDYRGYTVCKAGPWSQGPVFLQQLALLDGFDLDAMPPDGPDFVHTVIECAKLAFADRERFYGDPDFVAVPMDTLLSRPYNDARRALVGETASMALRPGEVPGFGAAPVVRAAGSARPGEGTGEPTVKRFDQGSTGADGTTRGDTCHFDIIDRHGNMIAGTPSGGWLQSSPVIPALGFCLTSRAQMYWLEEGHPAALAPGKRPRTTLSPSLALRGGEPYMVFGTPGGDQQDQWPLQLFLRHVHGGMNLQQAIDAPAFHTAHFPSSFYPRESQPGHLAAESRFPAATLDALRERGHRLEVDGPWTISRSTAAAKDGPVLRAGANPRIMQGYAAGR